MPIKDISELTKTLLATEKISDFNQIIKKHEAIIAQTIELPRAKDLYFKGYNFGEIKSLGAWGGDFVLASSDLSKKNTLQYFYQKNFPICIPYVEMVL